MSQPAAESRAASGAWLAVSLLWLVALLNYLDRLTITTMRDAVKADIAMTDAQFGLLTSVFLWVYGAMSPLGGYLADRFSRRGVILVSLVVWSAVTWWTGHVHTLTELLWARALMGVSEACYIPAALALISDLHPGRTRSLATGLHMSGVYAGAALGGIGGVIAERWGWRLAFDSLGLFGVAYGVVLFFLLRDSRAAAPSTPSSAPVSLHLGTVLRALFQQPGFWILLALNALVGAANWSINGWLPTYLKEKFALGLGAAGLSATGYIQIASFVGVLLGALAADRWSRREPRARAWVPGLTYAITGPCLFLATLTGSFPLAMLGLVAYGLGRGCFDANHMPVLRQVVDERYSATGYGVLNFISCAAGGVLTLIGGQMLDAKLGLGTLFQIAAVGLFIVAVLLFFIRPRPAAVPVS